MAKWPSPQDYREAIQNPHSCFFDGELRCGYAEPDLFELPMVHCGQYAAVFKLNTARIFEDAKRLDENENKFPDIQEWLEKLNK